MKFSLFVCSLFTLSLFGQQKLPAPEQINVEILNQLILQEVNQLRHKVKLPALYTDTLLKASAVDHVGYMLKQQVVSHNQSSTLKKTPKDRVDFYGEYFNVIGENILSTQFNKGSKEIFITYEKLAEGLVKKWRQSPEHYANIIKKDYSTTYTAIAVTNNGTLYACQLFGSIPFTNLLRNSKLTYNYRNESKLGCIRSANSAKKLSTHITESGTIILTADKARYLKKGVRMNPFGDGIAADIVLKSQYLCDTGAAFNGKTNIRGIPLDPVMRKDFGKGTNQCFGKSVSVDLGQVPEWVDEEFEVNSLVINNGRSCKNVVLKPMDEFFEINLNVGLYIDSISQFYKIIEYDTIDHKITYNKSAYKAHDSLMAPIKAIMDSTKTHITKIELTGFSSIEGSTKLNESLYKKRAEVILKKIKGLGISGDKVIITALENFTEFRRDIQDTKFAYLDTLEDIELKKLINTSGLAKTLEPVLANHRYTKLTVYTEEYKTIKYDKSKLYDQFNYYVSSGNRSGCRKLQSIEYNLAKSGEISVEQVKKFYIPFEKNYKDLLHDRALMIYKLDSLNPNAAKNFELTLKELKTLDQGHTKINTSLVVLDYSNLKSYRIAKEFYQKLEKVQYVSPVILARMRLNLAARLDHTLANSNNIKFKGMYLYEDVKRQIKFAKLTPEEMMQLVRYYAYFKQYDYAYNLAKKAILRTTLKADRIFFLKMIFYSDLYLPGEAKLKHLKQLQTITGDEFCTYFNSPNLNFQLFDDPKILALYCKECQ